VPFIEQLQASWAASGSLVCVGLDPDVSRLPVGLKIRGREAIFDFNKAIVDATHDIICAFKPQIAYFAAESSEEQLVRTIDYIKSNYPRVPVILDAKRGDIGSTAEKYAVEVFERYQADAVTVNPYLGRDSIKPFTDYKDKGVILLCRTSNPGAADLQDLVVDGKPLYIGVAQLARHKWNEHGNCCLVVGATWPEQLAQVREIVGEMPILVPGVGAQGGDVEATVRAGQTAAGTGLVISSSRAVLYASTGEDFAQAARTVALQLRDQINEHRARA
jgi:orotidine-5'-phosphate decarboxylase